MDIMAVVIVGYVWIAVSALTLDTWARPLAPHEPDLNKQLQEAEWSQELTLDDVKE